MSAAALARRDRIDGAMLTIRGHGVMLDVDLARLYKVETRALVQAVKRNADRFPADFMIKLTSAEVADLKSQSVISSYAHGGRRTAPYAFTEQGVAMLSTVLRSQRAIRANIEIMRAFVRMRRALYPTAALAKRLVELETQCDARFKIVFTAIRELMAPPVGPRKRIWLRRVRIAAPVLASVLFASCAARSTAPRLVERAGAAMGSDLRLSAWTVDEAAANRAFDAVAAEFDRLDGLMSVWRPASDVVRINAAAGERAVAVSAEVREVLRAARQVSEWTGGKFDVTFGALSDIWKFDYQNQDGSVPAPDAIRARLPLVDYRAIEIDDRAGTVFVRRKGMRVHLGGIGKGYAIERAVGILRRAALGDFVIQAGGDLYVAGRKNGRPWRLGIADPRRPDRTFATIDLSDSTFSTSGDYSRSFMKDGVRYHHILDPATGQPARGCRSVTIVADSPLLADGLSTGVFLLGPEAGLALIERLPDVEGVIVSAKNEVLVSSGLKGKLAIVAPPTDAP